MKLHPSTGFGFGTLVSMLFKMPDMTMGGLHDVRVHLLTHDPSMPDKALKVLSNWVESQSNRASISEARSRAEGFSAASVTFDAFPSTLYPLSLLTWSVYGGNPSFH